MKITILQKDILWCAIQENRKRAEEMMFGCTGTDLFVLPEMFTTGFNMSPENIAESNDGDTLRWMKHTASRINCAIAGSVIVQESDKYYNRFYFVCPDGSYIHYDKVHLFAYGGEDRFYTPGRERVVTTFRGVRIMLAICYDLRFPVWARNKGDYDMIIYVANWPTARIKAWDTLLHARAIENQCYVVGVNRVGADPSCEYSGMSYVIDPYGNDIVSIKQNVETCASAVIDMERLEHFRKKFPVLNDSDSFSLL